MAKTDYLSVPNFVPAKRNKKKTIKSVIYYTVGVCLSLLFILPLLYMFATATKTDEQIAQANGTIMMFIPEFASLFDNYGALFEKTMILRYALNSLLYAVIIIVLNTLVNGLAGYVIAKFDFPGKSFFTFLILFLIVVPVETSIIPLYTIARDMLGLKKELSFFAVIFPGAISIFNIFLYIQFFSSIPKEFEEAMHIDGSSRVRIFFDLILPLSKPIIATTAVFTFIGVWNDYVWPSMALSNAKDWWTVQAALNTLQADPMTSGGQWMAALVVTTLPIFIVYAAAQKYIVKGFGTAGLKM